MSTEGSVVCWGGGAGLGLAFPPDGNDFVAVTGYAQTACALRASGEAECCDSTGDDWPVEPGPFVAVTTGTRFACGLRPDSTVYCWGDNAPSGTPTGAFRQINGGTGQVCGLRADGSVTCWGYDAMNPPPAGNDFERVAVHVSRACALSPRGIECWGTRDPAELAVTFENPITCLTLDVASDQECAVLGSNEIRCWRGTVPVTGQYVDIALGDNQTGCAVAVDGSVECWPDSWILAEVPEGLRVF